MKLRHYEWHRTSSPRACSFWFLTLWLLLLVSASCWPLELKNQELCLTDSWASHPVTGCVWLLLPALCSSYTSAPSSLFFLNIPTTPDFPLSSSLSSPPPPKSPAQSCWINLSKKACILSFFCLKSFLSFLKIDSQVVSKSCGLPLKVFILCLFSLFWPNTPSFFPALLILAPRLFMPPVLFLHLPVPKEQIRYCLPPKPLLNTSCLL